jgi:hypothetical protein
MGPILTDAVAAFAEPLDAEPEAPLQSIEVDATCSIEVDAYVLRHAYYSQSRRVIRDPES